MKFPADILLFKYEWDALKEALKRDVFIQKTMATIDPDQAHCYARNAGISQRILDILFGREGDSQASLSESRQQSTTF